MSRPALRILAIVVLLPFALSAESPNRQKIRSLDDPVWDDLHAVLLDAGRVEVSPTPPYPDSRILAELDAIDPAALSQPAREARSRILDELSESLPLRAGPASGRVGLEATPAVDWRSSNSTPWIDGYADRKPLLSIPFEIAFADSVYGYSALALKADPNLVAAGPLTPGGFNVAEIAAAPIGIDATFPFRAFGSVGGSWWNFQIGRDRLSMGSAGPWNLTISSAAEFYDFARLSLFGPSFAYSGLVVQLNPDRNIYMHRFDLRFGGGLSLGVTEGTLIGQAPLELRYLNPLMVFHGFQSWSDYEYLGIGYKEGSASEIGLEINWSPIPWFSLSAQYEMNQISDPLKMLFWSGTVSEIPDGESLLGSLSLRVPVENAFIVVKMTGAYTTPLDYLSTGTVLSNALGNLLSSPTESPISWIYDRPTKSNPISGASSTVTRSLSWIGFSEGPDTILAALSAGLDAGSAWSVLGDLEWKAKGAENSFATVNDWDKPNPTLATLTTPSGTVEYDLVAGITARTGLPPLTAGLRCSVSGAVHWTGRWNAGVPVHVSGSFDQSWEIDAAATFALR